MSTEVENQGQSIVVDYDLPHSADKIWRALTDAKLVATWLMQNDLRAEVGHQFTFRAQPMGDWDGIVQCEVLEVELERKLSYSWRGGTDKPGSFGSRLDTVVTWTLSPSPTGGTRLRLEHAGFLPKNAFAFENMGKGWRGGISDRLVKAVESLD